MTVPRKVRVILFICHMFVCFVLYVSLFRVVCWSVSCCMLVCFVLYVGLFRLFHLYVGLFHVVCLSHVRYMPVSCMFCYMLYVCLFHVCLLHQE